MKEIILELKTKKISLIITIKLTANFSNIKFGGSISIFLKIFQKYIQRRKLGLEKKLKGKIIIRK